MATLYRSSQINCLIDVMITSYFIVADNNVDDDDDDRYIVMLGDSTLKVYEGMTLSAVWLHCYLFQINQKNSLEFIRIILCFSVF